MIEQTVIAELKHVAQGFCSAHDIQLINYLMYWNKEVGLLCNFAQESLRTKRLYNNRPIPVIASPTSAEAVTAHDRAIVGMIRSILKPIIDNRLFAYDLGCLLRIFEREAVCQELGCHLLTVHPRFGSCKLPSRSVKALQLDGSAVVVLAGNPTGPSPQDRARLQSYTRHARCPRGALVNFGRSEVSISLHNG